MGSMSKLVVAILSTLSLSALACSPDTDPGPGPAPTASVVDARLVAESRDAFVARGDDYRYTQFSQSWTGSWGRTEQVVRAGAVIERVVVRGNTADDGARAVEERVEESGATLGTTEGGHPVSTIPQLYDVCVNDILTQDPEHNILGLGFHDDGVLAYCTYRPKGCVDDCNIGVVIDTVVFE